MKVMTGSKYLVLSTGFAMFSMFFGSGNLTFPMAAGFESGGHIVWGALGILVAGVLIPFLGVLAISLYDGDTHSFFALLGKRWSLPFSLLALGLIGPFGVLARCITVAHGSINLLFPGFSLLLFGFLFCGLLFVLTVREMQIVPLLGSVLTPFLLASLAAIVIFALRGHPLPEATGASGGAFVQGLLQGYQTMDLVAGFFFSTFVIAYLRRREEGGSFLPIFGQSAAIGGGILALVYISLVLLGAIYAPQLKGVPPQEMLGSVASYALGPLAGPLVCVAIMLACVTTAVVLAKLFAEFLDRELCRGKLGNGVAMALTLIIAYAVSTFEFSGISRFLGPILEVSYPAIIVFTLASIAHKLWGVPMRRWPALLTLGVALVLKCV